MPLVHKPSPLPSDLKHVPKDSEPHTVETGESWWTLAETPQARSAKMSAGDLCYFNFKTRNPREINWYLHNKIGCLATTFDEKNYKFSSKDRLSKTATTPGIIYLPRIAAVVPTQPPRKEPDEVRLNLWVGLGGKIGTQVVADGIETMEGFVVDLDSPHSWMVLQASTTRLGPGFGASGGVCLIVVTGVSRPAQLNGFETGGVDFTLALGGKWDKFIKGSREVKKLEPFIMAVKKLGERTPGGLKKLLKTEPGKYGDLVKAGLQFRETLGSKADEMNVWLVDIWGAGTEISLFHGVTKFTALVDSN